MNKLHSFMHRLHNSELASLFLRIALGVVFINAWWMKVANMEMTAGFFNTMGIPTWLAYLVTWIELLGGVALIAGIFVRYVGVLSAIIMLVATILMFGKGFSLANGGYEYTFVLLLASMALVTLGSGKYSLASCLKNKK